MTDSGEHAALADAEFMRQATEQSRRALERGNGTYGAVLFAADGRVLAEGQNTVAF